MNGRFRWAIVVAVAAACASVLGCGEDRQAKPGATKEASPESRPKAAPVTGQKPATSWEEYAKYFRQWFEETNVANYDAYGERSAEWDSKVRAYFAEYARSTEVGNDPELLAHLERLGEELSDQGCSDPTVLYLRGTVLHRLQRPREALPLIQRTLSSLDASDYPPYCSFYTVRRLEWIRAELPGPLSRASAGLTRRKMKYLGQAAGNPHFANGNQRFYVQDVVGIWADDCANPPHAKVMLDELEKLRDVDPWIEHMVKGLYHHGLGWEARGGGWASGVSAHGWEVFGKELKTAEEHFVEDHRLHPEFPEAATQMIGVSMAMGGDVSPRQWFDRAVAAQFDYYPAYIRFLWALRPRWGGSHEAMYAFGVECLKTGRFETDVPRFFLRVVWDIGSEMEDWRAAYRRPGTYALMKSFFEGVLAEPGREAQRDYFKTAHGLVAWAAGEYQDARNRFDELGDKADPFAFESFRLDPDIVLGDVHLRTGPLKEKYAAAEKLFLEGQSIEALPLYRELSEKVSDDPPAAVLLQHRLATLEMKEAFLAGDWVDILPDETCAGWEKKGGEWAVADDGSLTGTARKGDTRIMLLSECELRDNYEIRGKVTADSFVGVVLGYTKSVTATYVSFTIDSYRQNVSLSKRFGSSSIDRSKAVGATNRFHVQVWDSQVTVYLNDEPIFVAEDVAALGDPRVGRIGIGCPAYQAEGYQIKYHSLELRRLEVKPEEPQETRKAG
jgi:hypothetical protein